VYQWVGEKYGQDFTRSSVTTMDKTCARSEAKHVLAYASLYVTVLAISNKLMPFYFSKFYVKGQLNCLATTNADPMDNRASSEIQT